MKLLYLSLVVLGAFAVHRKKNEEEAVGAHKVHGNVALIDGNGNTVKASCGSPDRRGKLTNGRTEWVNGKQMCVDWNPGTIGDNTMTRECGKYGMKCCDQDEVLMENQMSYDGTLICKYDVPMCMKISTGTPGYVTFEPYRCNLGDGSVNYCDHDFACCDEGSNYMNADTHECQYRARSPQPKRPEVVEDEPNKEFGCNADFKDSEGDGCAIYEEDDYCDEFFYDDYTNDKGETARVCPQCGCEEAVGGETSLARENGRLARANKALRKVLQSLLN